jgi:EAL domain-containing protein (putative c-di-GMP-specific phosphodiesterase class I)
MADALHLSVTVEGVETHAQLQALRALSHGTVQGFHIGQARPIAAFADLLDAATIAAAVRPAVTSPVGMP